MVGSDQQRMTGNDHVAADFDTAPAVDLTEPTNVTVAFHFDMLRRYYFGTGEQVRVRSGVHAKSSKVCYPKVVPGNMGECTVVDEFGKPSSRTDETCQCGDSKRHRDTSDPLGWPSTVLYVTKHPPSSSGVALYATAFRRVLESISVVTLLDAPSEPSRSQTLRAALAGITRSWRHDVSSYDLVHVELSGRSLYEFNFAVGLLLRRSRPAVVLTCHDPPSVVGANMLFTLLDRRGLRGIGLWLSNGIGRRIEFWAMNRADAVLTLTQAGAFALEQRYHRTVMALAHVTEPNDHSPRDQQVFFPGYLNDANTVVKVIMEILEAPSSNWNVVVGSCPQHAEEFIRAAIPSRFRDRVSFLGFVGESELVRQYASSRLVVRIVGPGSLSNSMAASGPLSLAIASGSAVVTNDQRPGALELVERGAILYSSEPAEAVRRLVMSPRQLTMLAERALEVARTRSPVAIAHAYRNILSTIAPGRSTL